MDIKVKIETEDFYNIVLPVLEENWIEFENLEQVENIEHKALRQMDFHGFDYIYTDCGIRGLSIRIQYGSTNWESFSIRYYTPKRGTDTEYQKKLEALDSGALMTEYTIQAYINNGKLMSLGMVKTRDLFQYLKKGGRKKLKINSSDGIRFFVVDWIDLQRDGYEVTVIENE